jgi:membrane protease YdiL (CAAX protease family)
MINILPFFVPVLYFTFSWFFPWEVIKLDSSVSITYLYDIFFVAISALILKPKFGLRVKVTFFIRLLFVSALALVCIMMTAQFNISAPFKYVDNLFIQILILAPIIEEFIFRFTFFEIFKKKISNKKAFYFLNAFLLSLSHAGALSVLPEEFFPYVFFQILYTFFLGWVCARAKDESDSIVEPILLHFVFNLFFYFAVINQVI